MSSPPERLATALADRYRIERELGAGGMATVYLAADLKHDRKVAIKVLRPELAAVIGAERFLAEIKTTANLQHPHILPLFDSGEADGFLYYVMPYVEGETLREKLDRETQLGIEEAVRIGCEVADALDYAHRQRVIHRDIKPENVLLQDGRALVADFGIALAVSAAGSGRMTETGLSLGTPHYMSPEQATAEKDLTARADLYSLGCMLYEMLAGSPPHVGASAQQIIMKIVTEEAAPVSSLRKSVPLNVAAAVGRSLEKLPADRFESAGAFADALRDPAFTGGASGRAAAHLGSGGRSGLPTPAAIGVGVVLLALGAWGWLRPTASPEVTRYGLALPPDQAPRVNQVPRPLDDGSLVYLGPDAGGGVFSQVWLKLRDAYEAVPIEGTVGTRGQFAVSPDGLEIVLAGGGRGPRRVPLQGGGEQPLSLPDDVGSAVNAFEWLDDGSILFVVPGAPSSRLMRVPAEGGEASVLFEVQDGTLRVGGGIRGSSAVLLETCDLPTSAECTVHGLDLETLQVRELTAGKSPAFAETGHLLYWVDGTVFAAPLDIDRLELTGTRVPLVTGVRDVPFRLSRTGTLVMRAGGAARELHAMVWVDRAGTETPLDESWSFDPLISEGNAGWALSPDGSTLAIGLVTESGEDIWIRQLAGGRLMRSTFEEGMEGRPRWTPDGRSITYVGGSGNAVGLYERRVDGTGSPRLLFAESVSEGVWHPNGEWVLLRYGQTTAAVGGRDITGIRPGVTTAAVPLLASRFDESAVAPSPDGRWLAYQSDEAGALNVFVVPFPETDGGKWQVSASGGRGPLWSRDGSELFYVSPDEEMMAVSVTGSGDTPVLGQPEVLFEIPESYLAVYSGRYYTQWDVASDGRFIMARRLNDQGGGAIIVVENFLEELKRRMAR